MLEKSNIPFTGSNASTISLCNDKAEIKNLLLRHNLPAPKFQIFKSENVPINKNLNYPLIVKPTLEYNSKSGFEYGLQFSGSIQAYGTIIQLFNQQNTSTHIKKI